jgi:prepilin-type N-terminal cleavage/methylation domain-containing protein
MEQKEKLLKGFTLIELVVVMAVFLFVVGAVIGIFLSVVQHQRKILSEQQLLNQISYVQEYMSRALRMAAADASGSCLGSSNAGYIYLLTRYDSVSQVFKGIKFMNQSDNNACQEFFLDTDGVLKEIRNGASPVAITSSVLQINSVMFSINGSDGSAKGCVSANQCGASDTDAVQPRVTILLNVSIPGETARTIQTTVSQRNLNIK